MNPENVTAHQLRQQARVAAQQARNDLLAAAHAALCMLAKYGGGIVMVLSLGLLLASMLEPVTLAGAFAVSLLTLALTFPLALMVLFYAACIAMVFVGFIGFSVPG